jgi:hypothetical protein
MGIQLHAPAIVERLLKFNFLPRGSIGLKDGCNSGVKRGIIAV